MIAAWMLYCMALGMLLVGAGLLAERAAAILGRSTRRIWALALTAAVTLPTLGVILRSADLPESALFAETAPATPVAGLLVESVALLSVLDMLLLDAWWMATAGLSGGVALLWALTVWRRRGWSAGRVDGVPVLVSDDVGPAVVGVLRSRVVFPRWALDADSRQRGLMLRHELEHLEGRDPQLLLFGTVLALLMPWNLALWYMLRRLRLAVEVDCDARVLRGNRTDVGAYGYLLLSVGRRRAAPAWPTAAFSRPRSSLEHRIDLMTRGRASHARLRAAGLVAAVAGLVALAWSVPQPVRAADASRLLVACPAALGQESDGAAVPGVLPAAAFSDAGGGAA